jgi:hypothetical protein
MYDRHGRRLRDGNDRRDRSTPSREQVGLAPSALLALQRSAGNQAAARVIQRRIDSQVDIGKVRKLQAGFDTTDPPWYAESIETVIRLNDQVGAAIRKHNRLERQQQPGGARGELERLVNLMRKLVKEVDEEALVNVGTDLTDTGKALYGELVKYKSRLTALSTTINTEVARLHGVTRAGPGGRPDANKESAINESVSGGGLGLTVPETTFVNDFTRDQGGTWKQRREALSAVWAMQQGLFTDLRSGHLNQYGKDVEYETNDPGKPQLWDQKTIFVDQTGFDGRLRKTHGKNKDTQGRGVGLLFDSTFEGRTNYEKVWLEISQHLMDGVFPGSAVKEVVAPNPDAFRAGIYIDMTRHATSQDPEEDGNVRWAEKKLAGYQDPDGLEVIDASKLGGTGLDDIQAGTEQSYNRYTNNRDWLPTGAYSEFGAKGPPNPGKAKYIASDAATPDKRRIYLSVTHYKGYTVRKVGHGDLNRNAFYRVL